MKTKIFLVEDERIVAKDVEGMLNNLGYEVVGIASSGKEALQKIEITEPDLILMDIRIRGNMDGIEVASRIHEKRDIPIIYVTAYADDKTLERAKITGPFGYIIKPFQERDIKTAIEIGLYKHKMEKEKKVLSDKVIKLTKRIPLTNKEKSVFHAIVKYPLMNDIGLSKKLHLNRSTITAIRNRLRSDGLYRTYRIPNFSALGCELMTAMYSKLNSTGHEKRKRMKEFKEVPQQVLLDATNREMFGLMVSGSLTEMKREFDKIQAKFKENNLTPRINTVFFPLELTDVKKFFDYSQFLNSLFDLKEDPLQKGFFGKARKNKLTKNERKVMLALVEHGELNDSDIAKKIRLPRTTVSQIRRRLLDANLLSVVNIPNLIKLRCELMVANHYKFNSKEDMKKTCEYLHKNPSCILLVSKDIEVYSVNVYNDYNEYEMERNGEDKYLGQANLKIEDHISHILAVPQLQYRKMDFAGLIKEILK